jgi:hypothetical protein
MIMLAEHSHIAAAGVMLGRAELTDRVGEALVQLDAKPDTPGVISACLAEAFDAMLPSGFVWRGSAVEIDAPLNIGDHPQRSGFVLSPGYDLPHPRRDGDTPGDHAEARAVEFGADRLATAAVGAATFLAWRRLRYLR